MKRAFGNLIAVRASCYVAATAVPHAALVGYDATQGRAVAGLPSVAGTALVISVTVAIVAFCCFVIIEALSVVLVFFVAIIVGEALRPLVDRFAKHVNRSLAIALVRMAFGLVATGLVALLILLVMLTTAFWLASSDALGASLLGLVPLVLRSGARDLFSKMGTTLGLYAGGVLLNGSIVAKFVADSQFGNAP
jgi:predicted PurR-regulated permease PerM